MKVVPGLIMAFGLFCLTLTTVSSAADVPLQWDKVTGAESYEIDRATCAGATLTFEDSRDAGAGGVDPIDGKYIYADAPEDQIVLFRITAVSGADKSTRTWSGAWFDERLKPMRTPGGAGIP